MSTQVLLRAVMGTLFILYLSPWILLAHSLQEGMIGVKSKPDGSLFLWNDSPITIELKLTFYAKDQIVYSVEKTLRPDDRASIKLPPEVAGTDSIGIQISTMEIVKVEAKWSFG